MSLQCSGRDPAEWTEASYQDHPADRIDTFHAGAAAILSASRSLANTLDALTALHMELAPHDCGCWAAWIDKLNAKLAKMKHEDRVKRIAFLFAIGVPQLEGHSMTEAANALGVTRAAVSKCVCQWRDSIGLPANRYTKSDDARQSYKRAHTSPAPGRESPKSQG
jgi:hypothetical protein